MKYCQPTQYQLTIRSCIFAVRGKKQPIKNIENFFIAEVAKEFEVHPNLIKSPERGRTLANCRKFIVKLLYSYTKYTSVRIGEILNRDHSSILWCKQSFEDLYDTEKAFKARFEKVHDRIRLAIADNVIEQCD